MPDFAEFVERTEVRTGSAALFRLEQNHFLVKTCDGLLVHIDPFLSRRVKPENHVYPRPLLAPEETRADYAFLTHDHRDHTDPDTLKPLAWANPRCVFVGPRESCGRLRDLGVGEERLVEIVEGETIDLGPFRAEAVPARGTDEENSPTHLGYVLSFGPIRIYNVGDTHRELSSYIDRLRAVRHLRPEVMMVPINEGYNNPGPEGARRLVEWVDPLRIVPCHYDCFKHNSIDPARFVEILDEPFRSRVRLLARGERLIVR